MLLWLQTTAFAAGALDMVDGRSDRQDTNELPWKQRFFLCNFMTCSFTMFHLSFVETATLMFVDETSLASFDIICTVPEVDVLQGSYWRGLMWLARTPLGLLAEAGVQIVNISKSRSPVCL